MENESTSGRDRPSCLVIVRLRSIGEEQINNIILMILIFKSFKVFEKTENVHVLNEMKNRFMVTLPPRRIRGCRGINARCK